MYRPPPRQGDASRLPATTPLSVHASESRSGSASASSLHAVISGTRDEEPRLFNPFVTVYTPLSPVSSPARPAILHREPHARNSLPSPPSSDPIPEHKVDVPVVRYEPIKVRYAGMKRRIAEVRASRGILAYIFSACLEIVACMATHSVLPPVAQARTGATLGASWSTQLWYCLSVSF